MCPPEPTDTNGRGPHFRLDFDPWTLVGIGIGAVLAVGGTEETLQPIRGSLSPWIVEDIDDIKKKLLLCGASLVRDIENVPTGRMMYMRHADGSVVEYVQWTPELAEKNIFAPLRDGTPASQI